MKKILQILANIFVLIYYFMGAVFLLLWYGDLIKVSPYHGYSRKFRTPMKMTDWMDTYFQSEACVSQNTIRDIEHKTVEEIGRSSMYKEYLQDLTIPIYQKGESIGTQTVYSVLVQSITPRT